MVRIDPAGLPITTVPVAGIARDVWCERDRGAGVVSRKAIMPVYHSHHHRVGSDREPNRGRVSRRSSFAIRFAIAWGTLLAGGCSMFDWVRPGPHDDHTSYHDSVGLTIEYPEVGSCASGQTAASISARAASSPWALRDPSELPTFELSLPDAIRMAVAESPVMRSIGASVVQQPAGTTTIYDPAITASTQLGTEAALAAFDANYNQQLFWSNVDQPSNRRPFSLPGVAGGVPLVFAPFAKSRNATFISELSKQTATGARFALRHNVSYAKTQDPSVVQQRFPSSFIGFIEGEYRQPLMQGAGTTFNRIAGPTQVVGQYNGVLIARINEDVSLADFEARVIQLVGDVEAAYWNLALAYRVLAANVAGRDSAQRTYEFQRVRLEAGAGRADEEAQARSQYYQFQAQVEQTLGGTQGLYESEQNLRYLVGLPATDGRLIRPVTDPTDVQVVFDWDSSLSQALYRRVEIRRQKFNVKRRELELCAARLNRRPRLDFLALYRWRGLGDHLIGDGDGGEFEDLYGSITDGDYQEGQAGVELTFPVGLRLASVAVSNAKLNLRREQALLEETELRISHDLSAVARQVELTFQLVETNFARFQADLKQVEVLRRRYRDGNDNINFLLQAQRQVVASETAFYQSLIQYNLAIRDLHREKGSLLAYNQVQLAEGPWHPCAYQDAHTMGRFLQPRPCPEAVCVPPPLTAGPFEPSAVQPSAAIASATMLGGDEFSPASAEAVAASSGDMSEQTPSTDNDPGAGEDSAEADKSADAGESADAELIDAAPDTESKSRPKRPTGAERPGTGSGRPGTGSGLKDLLDIAR